MPDGGGSAAPQESRPGTEAEERLYTLTPAHVLAVGAGILGSGILLTGSLSYRQAGKQLVAEGIDASIRRRILPHAVKALAGSLLLTGAAAAGCFWAMESVGLVSSGSPTSASVFKTAVDMMLRPPQAIRQELAAAQQQQQQQQQQQRGQQQPAGSSQQQ